MNDLTNEYQRLVRLEEVVDKGVRNMLDAADALKEIRDNKLFRERGYRSFDRYLADEWGFGRSYINKIIKSSETRKRLGTLVPDYDTSSLAETALRELNDIPDEKLEDIIDLASISAKTEGKRVTAQSIRDARDSSATEVDPSPDSLKVIDVGKKESESNPYGLPQEKLDKSRRIALNNVDTLLRHLDFLGIKQYDNTLAKVRETLDK